MEKQKELYELVKNVANTFTKDDGTYTLAKNNLQAINELAAYVIKVNE